MKMFRKYFLFIMFILFGFMANGQTGCIGSSTGILYTNGSGSNYDVGSGVANPYSVFCIRNTGSGCKIFLYGFIQVGTGTIVNYSALPCPIDDYVPFALVLVGGAGWYWIRKRKDSNELILD